uniref:DUF7659 family protein n=1 Tax=Prevotella sp. TaxID=59823 RepID=UPI0040270B81
MIKYSVYKKRQQDEFNKLPMKAAFGVKQFEEMMEAWGLTTSDEDLKKVASLGAGGYCLKKDFHLFEEFGDKSAKEMEEYFKDDEQLSDAFMYEFGNHECGYTGNPREALYALGYTEKDVATDERLDRIFNETWRKYIDNIKDY